VREETPDEVLRAYRIERLSFNTEYILPKPFDSRVVLAAAPAVAQAAIESGVARRQLDMATYRQELAHRLSHNREVVRLVMRRRPPVPAVSSFPKGTSRGCCVPVAWSPRRGSLSPSSSVTKPRS